MDHELIFPVWCRTLVSRHAEQLQPWQWQAAYQMFKRSSFCESGRCTRFWPRPELVSACMGRSVSITPHSQWQPDSLLHEQSGSYRAVDWWVFSTLPHTWDCWSTSTVWAFHIARYKWSWSRALRSKPETLQWWLWVMVGDLCWHWNRQSVIIWTWQRHLCHCSCQQDMTVE